MKFIINRVAAASVLGAVALHAQAPGTMEARARGAVKESQGVAVAAWNRLKEGPAGLQTLGTDVETFSRMSLDAGVPVFWLTMEAVAAVAGGRTTLEAAARNDDVVFPITANGSGNRVMVLSRIGQGWQQDTVGRETLARTLVSIRSADAARNKLSPESYFAVEVPALRRFFLGRGAGDAMRLIPLDTEEVLKFTAGNPMPVPAVMEALLSHYNQRRKPQ